MSSTFWKSVLISPVILGITLFLSTGVMASPKTGSEPVRNTSDNLILNKASGSQPVTIAASEPTPATKPETDSPEVVSEIVKPGDWQYTALQGVAAKYGCNSNLNNQPVSQIEFARGLNTCLVAVEPMLAQQPTAVTAADLEVIKRLTQEYRAQLTEIDGRLIGADKKIAQAQANQFSTTTKLKGEVIFNLTGALSGSNSNNIVLGDRVRLLFESSFSGQDKLWTRLAAGNQPGVNTNLKNGPTGEGTQVSEGFVAVPGSTANSVGLDWLAYQFPVSNTNVYVAAWNGIHVDYAPSYGSNFDDFTGGSGALSTFAESSPIYKIGGGAGVGTNFPISETGLKSFTVGYLSGSANNPAQGQGLFNGDYALLGQLNFKFNDKFEAGLTYVNSYHTGVNPIYGFGGPASLTGTLGSAVTPLANFNANGTTANSYGAEFTYKASDTLAFNGFVLNTSANKAAIGKQDIWSYGAGLSLPNVDGKGSLVGLLVGAEPYVGGAGNTPYHLEGFYKYKFSDNLSITPGLIYLTAPSQTSGNGVVIGVVRTTFTF
ncbi:iron uptake porin [Chamaesiphon sp. VAR_48_metabat_135_sub]|uniref:iron uptake porin n=1 Tax=Chamaesiphon sp. VAR_48_metabat_135_sub TaxID=2964699 RepID=UPI00286ACB50|nr:iron uptake porin [Chamaesiphon sp. VAR_48_metabat_135_sub]